MEIQIDFVLLEVNIANETRVVYIKALPASCPSAQVQEKEREKEKQKQWKIKTRKTKDFSFVHTAVPCLFSVFLLKPHFM